MSLDTARSNASLLRYAGELTKSESGGPVVREDAWRTAVADALEIVPAVLPDISEVVLKACGRLALPSGSVRAFVYPSSELQACCIPLDDETVAIRLSSALCQGFDTFELSYVVGHELGHFLLGHHVAPPFGGDSLPYFTELRAREISADRLGVVASGSVEPACRAIMKCSSGLTGSVLRFDVAQYLHDALRNIPSSGDPAIAYSTHPYLPVRARCLLGFGAFVSRHYPDWSTKHARADFEKLERMAQSDMDRYVEFSARVIERELFEDVSKWLWLAAACSDGLLGRDEQAVLSERFGGVDFVRRAMRSFSGADATEVRRFVAEKVVDAVERLARIAPTRIGSVSEELETSERRLGVSASVNTARAAFARFEAGFRNERNASSH